MWSSRTIRRPWRAAYSLVEVMLAIVIVGTAMTAAAQLFMVSTQQNQYGLQMSNGMMLAQGLFELISSKQFCDPIYGEQYYGPEPSETTLAQYNDVDDFDGQTLNPPIDAGGNQITALGQYTQKVTVVPIQTAGAKGVGITTPTTTDLSVALTVPSNTSDLTRDLPVKRVTIFVTCMTRNGPIEVARLSWLRCRNTN